MKKGGRQFTIKLALLYSAVFGLLGISMPFFPIWLKSIGIDVWWIGIITAVPSLTRFTIQPIITGFAERQNVLRQMIILLAFLTSLGFCIVGQFKQPLPILVAFIATASVWTPLIPLIDGYALKGVTKYRLDYGPLRLWGSAAFVVGAMVCGLLVDTFAATYLIWTIVAMALLGAAVSLGQSPLDMRAIGVELPVHPGTLLRRPEFLAIIFSSALVQGSHATYYAFASIAWQDAGFGGLMISILWALGVVAEIIVFAISPRFTWSPVMLVVFAAVGAALRWVLTAQLLPIPLLVLVQTMHGLSFGMTQVGIVGLLTRSVPISVMATAQGYLVAAGGFVMSGTTVISGALYTHYGEDTYYAMSAMALTGACLILLIRKRLGISMIKADQPQSAG